MQKSTQHSNVATNHTNHIQNSVQGTEVPNNHTEHIKNTAQGINVTSDENRTHSKQCIKH